jgi:hypothetical protein
VIKQVTATVAPRRTWERSFTQVVKAAQAAGRYTDVVSVAVGNVVVDSESFFWVNRDTAGLRWG